MIDIEKAREVERMLTDAKYADAAERQINEGCLRFSGKTVVELAKEMNECNNKNYLADMKIRDVMRKRQSDWELDAMLTNECLSN